MIFESLMESASANELILINGGICRWHMRKDRQITIREIISIRRGAGSEMLNKIKRIGLAQCASTIVAKCPQDLRANEWYLQKGFTCTKEGITRSGRKLKVWEYRI